MTKREREILIASVSWTDKTLTVNEEKAFQAGARWADKTMIDKACEWLKENIWVYINYEGCSGEELENDVIEDFRKAMEE